MSLTSKESIPRAPGLYPQVRWYSTPLAPTPTIFSGGGWSPIGYMDGLI